jgi:16S rRNA (cytosine967-C5)-methyltransferase
MKVMSPARKAAFDTLSGVEKGGYASDLLLANSLDLDPRDAGLAHEIVFGVLRYQGQLDFLIEHFSSRRVEKLDPEVRIVLRMGLYQLRYLERVPPHAAVAESVALVKRARKHSAAAFVNAVLRKVNQDPVEWPDATVALSHPGWLLDRWARQFGDETGRKIAEANLRPPGKYLRGGRRQDIGSQSIVPLLDLQPGQTFLDLCAAPGNKTAQALEYGVYAVACDVNLRRLRRLKDLGIDLVVADATRPLPFSRSFDRILVDAPCSGTGTLARNPEIKWRLKPSDIIELQARQAAMARNALERLTPGGRLVYSTCSLESEENEGVVKNLPVAEVMRRIPGLDEGDGFFAAVIRSD